MKHIKNKKTLVIADIHQNLRYVDTVLLLEQDWDHIVFMGDYLDCFEEPDNKTYFTVKNTCAWLNMKFHEYGDKATWLIGNHDISYLATYCKGRLSPRKNHYYYCSGYTRSKASDFNRTIDNDFIKKLELCVKVDDFYLSHAGFQYEHFEPYVSIESNIAALHSGWEEDKQTFFLQPNHWIWDISQIRGGTASKGSPVWCDWNEFVPIPEIKQVVGHTNMPYKIEKDGNYCIDHYRTCYAVIENNEIEIKWVAS